jgi:hypothetical protein
MVARDATEIIEIDRTRRRAAHLGTRHVQPHSAHVRAYTCGCHGKRTRMTFHKRGQVKRPISGASAAQAAIGGGDQCCRRLLDGQIPAGVQQVEAIEARQ